MSEKSSKTVGGHAHSHDHDRDHDHGSGGGHSHDHTRGADRRALWLVLALTGTYMVAEVVGGLLTGSLALLADAGHMLSDNVSLVVALAAFWLADRPPTPSRSFGYKRAEILAALFNGITLVAVSAWIFYEAARRFLEPSSVLGGWMMLVAAVGLLVNVAGAAILYRSSGESLNMQGAFRHVLADLVGSVGAIAAAAVIVLTGWVYADPIISVLIAVLVLASSWRLIKESVTILLEAAPPGVKVEEIGGAMVAVEGISEVHDLHVWTITSGFPALAAHVLVGGDEDCHSKRRELEDLLRSRYGISHTTLQMDHVGDHESSESRLQFVEVRKGKSD